MKSPTLEQRTEFRAQYPGVIILYRDGKALVAYDDQAQLVATLAGEKPSRWSDESPTLFFAFIKREHEILAMLVRAGCRVAICEQVDHSGGNPVERVVTDGSLVQ